MRTPILLAFLLAALALQAHAADPIWFKLDELRASSDVREIEQPPMAVYWGTKPATEFAEYSRIETYTRSGVSLSPFGGSARHCVEAFVKTLRSMVSDARARGYDAVLDLRVVKDGKPVQDPTGFYCTPGYKTTEVTLRGQFAMTTEAARRMAVDEERLDHLPPRPPAKNAIFLPLKPVLASPEAAAIAGPGIALFAGSESPKYRDRFGPDTWSGKAELGDQAMDDACRRAALDALKNMVGDAKERKYDTLIRIRSFLDSAYSPVSSDFECQRSSRTVEVVFKASLATRR
ncbi:MAG: hypothetical protein ACRENK_11870 [Gemmatimonadaceae bacterium]